MPRRPPPGEPPPRHGRHFHRILPPPPPDWPPPPRFVRHAGRARRGEVRLVLLDLLRDGPKHGYEIIRLLEERSGGQYVPSPGTIYPTLQFLEDAQLIASENEGDRRVYKLTAKGLTKLENHVEAVADFWTRYSQPEFSPGTLHELDFLHHELHELERTVLDGVRALLEGGQAARLRGLRQTLEKAKNQIRDVIAGVNES